MFALIYIKVAFQPGTSTTLQNHACGSVSRDVPVYSPSFCWVLTAPIHGGMAQAE